MPRYQRLEYHELSPALQAIITPEMPAAKKIAMARGLIPLGTRDLLLALYYLSGDREAAVAREAQKSLRELPESLTLVGIGADTSPKLLHFLATQEFDNNHLHEKVALHRNVQPDTLYYLAEHTRHESVLGIIAGNEKAILRYPFVLLGLTRNHQTPQSTIDRLKQFYQVEKGRAFEEDLPPEWRTVAAQPPPPPPVEPEPAAAAPATLEIPDERIHPCVRLPDLLTLDLPFDEMFADDLVQEPEQKLTDDRRTPLLKRIAKLTMVDKMLLAMRGNTETRRALIRNPNKLVQESVLQNQRLTITEIVEIVKERSMPQNVIDRICNNRDWTRYYEVQHQLCWHPKTPARFVFRALSMLNDKDLRKLAGSHNVPGFTRQQARSFLTRREKSR